MKYYNLLPFIILFSVFSSCTTTSPTGNLSEDRSAILKVMKMQEECWNDGNIDCFMTGYWKSDSLKFVGKESITYGWQATCDRYKQKYTSPELMGKLAFDIIELKISGNQAFMIGKWDLKRIPPLENVGGHFTLYWEKINNQWVIKTDHTS